MSGIDKGFLFGILTEVLRGNKRANFQSCGEIENNRRFEVEGEKYENWYYRIRTFR